MPRGQVGHVVVSGNPLNEQVHGVGHGMQPLSVHKLGVIQLPSSATPNGNLTRISTRPPYPSTVFL